jgi:hypothetical protein
MNMTKDKYSKRLTLTATEISAISICIRVSIKAGKQELQKANKEELQEIREYLEKTVKLQQKFQRLAVKIEKEVLEDSKNSR